MIDYTSRRAAHRDRHQNPSGAGARAPQIARSYVTALWIRCARWPDVRMDQGSMRCDANVNVSWPGRPNFRLTETKNVNSLKSVEVAVRYETWKARALFYARVVGSAGKPDTFTELAIPAGPHQRPPRTIGTSRSRIWPVAPIATVERLRARRSRIAVAEPQEDSAGGAGFLTQKDLGQRRQAQHPLLPPSSTARPAGGAWVGKLPGGANEAGHRADDWPSPCPGRSQHAGIGR